MEVAREVAKRCVTEWPYNGYVLLGTVTFGVSLWMLRKYFAGGVCRSKAMLYGKTVIITGANTGIGKETAIDLAKRNARVIIACRSQEKGKKAEVDVRRESGNSNVHFRKLDLASFDSVRRFAKDVLSEESRLDILINNAGVMNCPFQKTEDGFETQFGVNHLGHFLLTNLLLDKIKQAPEGRIVVVSSTGHSFTSKLDLDTINSEAHYGTYVAYFKSKLANVLFTKSLAKRLAGSNITVNSLCPGAVETELLRHSTGFNIISMPFRWLVFKNPRQGAQTIIYLAVSEDVKGVSGKHFCDCRVRAPSKLACDEELAEQLWVKSVQWTGL